MTRTNARVFSFDPAELEIAESLYQPDAKLGIQTISYEEREDVDPILAEYCNLLDITMPHLVKPPVIIEIEKLKAIAANDWAVENLSNDAPTPEWLDEIKVKHLNKLKAQLIPILSPYNTDVNQLLEQVLVLAEDVQIPEDLEKFFEEVLRITRDQLKNENLRKTKRDLQRSLHVDGVLMPEDVDFYKKTLLEKGIDPLIVEFLLEHTNQEELSGNNFLHKTLSSAFGERVATPCPSTVESHKRLNTNVTMDKESGEVIVTFQKTGTGYNIVDRPSYDFELPNQLQYKTYSQVRIQNTGKIDKEYPYKGIKVSVVDCYAEVYHPVARDIFFESRCEKAEKKIKADKDLTKNDRFAINVFTSKLKLPNGEIDTNRLNKANNNLLFLLMWNNVKDAEKVLTKLQTNFTPIDFFKRSSAEVKRDFELIANNHDFSPEVVSHVNTLSHLLTLVETKDVAGIATELNTANRHRMLLCLYTMTNVQDIKTLLDVPAIKNNLDISVLTHFAEQDSSIAQSILTATRWERARFYLKGKFQGRSATEKLPRSHFFDDGASPYLKRIIQKHPTFWDTLFSPIKTGFRSLFSTPSYRVKLEVPELVQLMSPKNPRNSSYYRAVYNIGNDELLMDKIKLHSQAVPNSSFRWTLRNRVQILQEDNNATLSTIKYNRDPKGRERPKLWNSIHGLLPNQTDKLTHEELHAFYVAKLNLDYRRLDLNLIQATEDLWSQPNSGRAVWSLIPTRPHKENAKAAVIEVLGRKYLNAEEAISNDWLRPNIKLPKRIKLSEVFITQPFQNAFLPESFPPPVMQQMQKTMLSNEQIFEDLFVEPKVDVRAINDFFEAILNMNPDSQRQNGEEVLTPIEQVKRNKDFLTEILINLFNHKGFTEALKQSVGLNRIMRQFLAHKEMKELIEHNFDLNRIAQNFPDEPSYTGPTAHGLLQQCFEDPTCYDLLKQIPQLEEFYEDLLVSARFKTAMQKQEDLFLFTTTWNILKNRTPATTVFIEDDEQSRKARNQLLEMIALLPEKSFENWLDQRKPDCNYLLELLLRNPGLYQEFCKLQLTTVKKLLIRKAQTDINQLTLLMLNCKELGEEYLSSIKTATKGKTLALLKGFKEFLDAQDYMDLALLIAKYPSLLSLIKKADLFETYKDKIDRALSHANLVIKATDIATVQVVNNFTQDKIKKLSPHTNHIEGFNTQFSNLTESAAPLKVASHFIKQLRDKDSDKELLFSLLKNRSILSKLLDNIKIKGMTTRLGKIATLLKQGSLNLGDNAEDYKANFELFIEVILQRMIIDPIVLSALISDDTFRGLFNEAANEELLGKLFMLKQVELNPWAVGLNRMLAHEKKEMLFKQCLPELIKSKNFDTWFISQNQENRLFILNTAGQLLPHSTIEHFLNNPHGGYVAKDLVNWLMDQYQGVSGASEPRIRDILNSSDRARYYFIKKSDFIADEMITIAIKELKISKRGVLGKLAIDILRQPYINHIIENADPKKIMELLTKLKFYGQTDLVTSITKRIIEIININEEVCQRFAESNDLMKHCLQVGLEVDQKAGRLFLLKLFSLAELPKSIDVLMVEPVMNKSAVIAEDDDPKGKGKKKASSETLEVSDSPEEDGEEEKNTTPILFGERCWRMFIDNPEPNSLIQYFIYTLKQRNTIVGSNLDNSLLAMINNPMIWEKMISLEANPHLLQQLFITLFNHMQENSSDKGKEVFEIITQLGSLKLSEKPRLLNHIIDGISPTEVVDLILAGATLAENSGLTEAYLFQEYLEKDSLLNYLFIKADEEKLISLLKAKTEQLVPPFIAKAREQSSVGAAIRKRLCSHLPAEQNLLVCLMRRLDDQQPVITLINENRNDIYKAWVAELIKDASLLFDTSMVLRKDYITYLLTHGSTSDMLEIIKAVKGKVVKNDVIDFLYQILCDNSPARSEANVQFILGLFDQPNENLDDTHLNLIEAFLRDLSLEEIDKMLCSRKNRPLARICLKYFRARPDHLEEIYGKSEETIDTFYRYVGISTMSLDWYLLLNEALPKSEITRIFDEKLEEDEDTTLTILATANSVQKAKIFNYEYYKNDGKKTTHKPFTPHLLQIREFTKSMFESLPIIDSRIAFCDPIRQILDKSMREDPTRALFETYYANFDHRVQPLRFYVNETLTDRHRFAFLYLLHLKLYNNKKAAPRAVDHHCDHYIKSVQSIADLDETGVFRLKEPPIAFFPRDHVFKGNETKVPLEYAIPFYEALSFFFYDKEDVKKIIENKRDFAVSLTQSLVFDENGIASYNSPLIDKEERPSAYYVHAVLFAYSQYPDLIPSQSNSISLAVLESVTIGAGERIIYAVKNRQAEPAQVYLDLVQTNLRMIARALNDEITIDSTKLRMICTLPDFDELVANRDLCLAIINSVYVDCHNVVRFKDTKAIVPESYLDKVHQLIPESYQQFDNLDSLPLLTLVNQMPNRDEHYPGFEDSIKDLILRPIMLPTSDLPEILLLIANTRVGQELGMPSKELVIGNFELALQTYIMVMLTKLAPRPSVLAAFISMIASTSAAEALAHRDIRFCRILSQAVTIADDGKLIFKALEGEQEKEIPLALYHIVMLANRKVDQGPEYSPLGRLNESYKRGSKAYGEGKVTVILPQELVGAEEAEMATLYPSFGLGTRVCPNTRHSKLSSFWKPRPQSIDQSRIGQPSREGAVIRNNPSQDYEKNKVYSNVHCQDDIDPYDYSDLLGGTDDLGGVEDADSSRRLRTQQV